MALFTLLLVSSLNAIAQDAKSVKGKVVTSAGYSPAGNVIAVNRNDSAFIKGAAFFEGNFELKDLPAKQMLLKFTSIEFKDTMIVVDLSNNSAIDLGRIPVSASSTLLGQVSVSARRPVYTHKNDGTLEITIANTILAASTSVSELLTKSPEIVVDEEGAIAVMGKGRAIFYLNGKRIPDNQLPMIMPGNIKTVEIIRNPSAKYDAEGAAVINITTITQRDDGYQITARQNTSYSEFGGLISYSAVNGNYRKGKVILSGNYALQLGEERERLHTTRNRDAQNVFLSSDLTTDWYRKFKGYNYYGFGAQYDIDKASYISLDYTGASENLGGNVVSSNKIIDTGTSVYKSDSKTNEKYRNNSLSLNYRKRLDTLNSSLFIGAQYSNFDNAYNNFIDEVGVKQSVSTSRVLRQLQNMDVDVFAAQVDFSKNFRNSDVLEFGARSSKVANDFDLNFLVSEDRVNYHQDLDRSNKFSYRETIAAGYVSFKSRFSKKFDYTIGVRGEYTDYDLRLLKFNSQEIKNNYFNILPNLLANIRFTKKFNLNLSYNSRVNRPPYQRLSPVLIYQDPYTSAQGNVNLKPEKRHAFEISTRVLKTVVKLGYNYTKDPFGQTVIRGIDPKSYILKRINYGSENEVFLSLSRTDNIKRWSTTNTFTVKYGNLQEEDLGFRRIEPRPNVYFYTNNRFDLGKSYSAEILFWFQGVNITGLHRRNSMHNLTLSLGKSYMKDALKVYLIANDMLTSFVQSGNYYVAETDVRYNRRASTNYCRLSISYNFGKLKKVDYKNKAIGSSENNRVN